MKKYGLDRIHPWVFWPPFLLLLAALVLSVAQPTVFQATVTTANNWILNHFDWLFNWTSFAMVILCLAVLFSPLGKVRIGGAEAKPMLSRWKWFSIILCTTIAVGILFWGSGEPLYHLYGPPNTEAFEAGGKAAAEFAMSTMYMHWSFTPYAIYAVPSLLFALAYYNRKRSYSLGSMLFPLGKVQGHWARIIDAVCLFALVAGMSASLGAGILSLSGGASNLSGWESSGLLLGVITLLIVVSFVWSASSGLKKGIRRLSDLNLRIFLLLVGVMLIFGPTVSIFEQLGTGVSTYVTNFVPHSLGIGDFSDQEWTRGWTTFYWANWMAWAPVTALFLGRIAYGRTVREFLLFTWVLPAVFGILWMTVFSGATLNFELTETLALGETLENKGLEAVIYHLFEAFPFTKALVVMFLLTILVSYVTAADSSTEAMAGLSATGVSPEAPNPPAAIKIIWGVTVGLVAWVMISFAGIDGVKMLSNLGGLPALLLLTATSIGLGWWIIQSFRKKV